MELFKNEYASAELTGSEAVFKFSPLALLALLAAKTEAQWDDAAVKMLKELADKVLAPKAE